MATISDVARKAQVSKSTVSRVLNGHSVREENRIKVMRAIKELGYSPNAQARSLTSGRTNVIGVMVPDMDGPFTALFLKAASRPFGSMVFICLSVQPTTKRAVSQTWSNCSGKNALTA